MSQENVEIFWRGTAAFNDGDWDAALATMDPNVEFDLSRVMPEMERYRGYEGVRAFWRMLRDVFGEFRTDPRRQLTQGTSCSPAAASVVAELQAALRRRTFSTKSSPSAREDRYW